MDPEGIILSETVMTETDINNGEIEGLEDFVIKRHDRHQFEIKLNYDFKNHRKKDRYRVETYFFIPNNLDVNELTYTKNHFYRDLLPYIRFKTPTFTLRALADTENERNPVRGLESIIDECLQNPAGPAVPKLEYEIKLFGCILKSTLRDHVYLVNRLYKRSGGQLDEEAAGFKWISQMEGFATHVPLITAAFRGLRERLKEAGLPKSVYSTFLFTDEYISLLVEWRALQLLRQLESMLPEHGEAIGRAMSGLAGLVRDEVEYRRKRGYPTVISRDDDNEIFVYRFGVLKKFVAQVLHLSVRKASERKGLEHFALGLAAGGSMIFATAIAFYYQRIYGTLSLGFFAALVVSYMFKDRIKVLLQESMQKLLSRTLFDQSTDIHDSLTGRKIGACRESFQFVDERHIDSNVVQLRDRDHLTEIENDLRREKVIYYLREITLFPAKFLQSRSRKSALNDIVRFNVQNFLSRMDEPETNLLFLEEAGSGQLTATRVYHVNLVIKLVSEGVARYEKVRLVLDQNGIKRVEAVASSLVKP